MSAVVDLTLISVVVGRTPRRLVSIDGLGEVTGGSSLPADRWRPFVKEYLDTSTWRAR